MHFFVLYNFENITWPSNASHWYQHCIILRERINFTDDCECCMHDNSWAFSVNLLAKSHEVPLVPLAYETQHLEWYFCLPWRMDFCVYITGECPLWQPPVYTVNNTGTPQFRPRMVLFFGKGQICVMLKKEKAVNRAGRVLMNNI